jgi:hypothetical protein
LPRRNAPAVAPVWPLARSTPFRLLLSRHGQSGRPPDRDKAPNFVGHVPPATALTNLCASRANML